MAEAHQSGEPAERNKATNLRVQFQRVETGGLLRQPKPKSPEGFL